MAETICHKFLETVKKYPEGAAVMNKKGGSWQDLTWTIYKEAVETIAAGLQTIGVGKGDRVAIFSNSRFEWAASDLAVLGLGAVTVPIYQSSTPDDILFILNDSQVKVLFCETPALARKFGSLLRKASHLKNMICFTSDEKTDDGEERFISLDELQARGEAALKTSPALYELAVREIRQEDMATIVYTSGTTGRPKGAVLTHTQILSEVADAFPLLGATVRDRTLSFLPYAHVLGRIEIWGHVLIGFTLAFAESIDRIKDNLSEVKPTIIVAVPRIFEKLYGGIMQKAEVSPVKKRVFERALSIGKEISRYKVEKHPVPISLALKYQLARRLVFNSITDAMGGRLRFAICGGAPLSRSIAEFFHAAGLLILEGYGLTETTAAITVNTPFDYRFGTVGKPIGDVKIKIAEDGEILVHSKKVMKEYLNDPESTRRALTDGWFHTGDIGELTSEGYLRITDRKKDLIKTAGGKYVAPQKLEGLLKANRFISQVHIHGDQKKYVVALVTLNWEAVLTYARENHLSLKSKHPESLATDPKVTELIRKAVSEANSNLASFESIKNFAILAHDFTIESGELTPSLKIKRKVVDKNYDRVINGLY